MCHFAIDNCRLILSDQNEHRHLPAIRGLSACLGSDSGKAAAIGAAPEAGRLGRGKDPLTTGATG